MSAEISVFRSTFIGNAYSFSILNAWRMILRVTKDKKVEK